MTPSIIVAVECAANVFPCADVSLNPAPIVAPSAAGSVLASKGLMRLVRMSCPIVGRVVAATLALLPLAHMPAPAQTPLPVPRNGSATEGKPLVLTPPSVEGLRQRDRELEALRTEQRKILEKEAKLKREIAALLEVCILLGGGDGVLAHIRDLKDVSNAPPAREFDRAARWAKQKLAQRRQSE